MSERVPVDLSEIAYRLEQKLRWVYNTTTRVWTRRGLGLQDIGYVCHFKFTFGIPLAAQCSALLRQAHRDFSLLFPLYKLGDVAACRTAACVLCTVQSETEWSVTVHYTQHTRCHVT